MGVSEHVTIKFDKENFHFFLYKITNNHDIIKLK